ncbi:MAG: hypothetical protein EBU90_29095 [Proteobacteria bacterium]|nr:hypothetical protein [Pseudomonadota bacterium]NBP16298.1 hypothetical protein [bacterium]
MDWLIEKQRKDIPVIGKLGKLTKKDLLRILDKVDDLGSLDANVCWIWKGTVQDKVGKGHQHGVIWYNRKYVHTHRIMYHNFIEDVPQYEPKKLIVLHKWSDKNNGRCINPWHLKLGTPYENTQDAMKANTLCLYQRNEHHPNAKLSNEKIQEIIKLQKSSLSQCEIAKMYDINQSQVSRYFNKKSRTIN